MAIIYCVQVSGRSSDTLRRGGFSYKAVAWRYLEVCYLEVRGLEKRRSPR